MWRVHLVSASFLAGEQGLFRRHAPSASLCSLPTGFATIPRSVAICHSANRPCSNPFEVLCKKIKAPTYLVSASFLAGEQGFEPQQTESESVVLPLHNSPKFINKTIITYFSHLSSRFLKLHLNLIHFYVNINAHENLGLQRSWQRTTLAVWGSGVRIPLAPPKRQSQDCLFLSFVKIIALQAIKGVYICF